MTLKAEVIELCKNIANDYDDWSYAAGAFKKKDYKHTELFIDPLWSFSGISALAQPVVGIKNKKIERIWRVVQRGRSYWSFSYPILYPDSSTKRYSLRIKNIGKDKAEEYLRTVLDKGFKHLDENYDLSSEQALLDNLPIHLADFLEEDGGTKYCIARIILGDFEYIERYYNDEIPTSRKKRKEDLEKILACLPEFREKYARTGSVI